MSEPFESEDTGSIVTLESLPAGSLSTSQIDSLDEADAIELAAPLVIDITTSRVTHFDLIFRRYAPLFGMESHGKSVGTNPRRGGYGG